MLANMIVQRWTKSNTLMRTVMVFAEYQYWLRSGFSRVWSRKVLICFNFSVFFFLSLSSSSLSPRGRGKRMSSTMVFIFSNKPCLLQNSACLHQNPTMYSTMFSFQYQEIPYMCISGNCIFFMSARNPFMPGLPSFFVKQCCMCCITCVHAFHGICIYLLF